MFKSAAAQGQEIIFMNLFDFEASEGLILLNLFYVIRQQKVVQSLHFFSKVYMHIFENKKQNSSGNCN